jgi:hypothetical protein
MLFHARQSGKGGRHDDRLEVLAVTGHFDMRKADALDGALDPNRG